ncbi:MAG: CotH kinase family protein [Bryobacteraceae bacterium]
MRHRYLGLFIAIAAAAQTVDDFFDDRYLRDIHLRVAPADWQSLKDRYLENVWFKAGFTWEGITAPVIGIRSRGSGSRVGFKPSLTFDFSKYDSSQTFLGMKTFVTRNLSQDASMMHERLTMGLFRRMGLPYEREVHFRLFVNDEYVGLYLALEPIDSRFLKTRFGEDGGYLYEFNWTGDNYQFEYLGDDPKDYCPLRFGPKNHDDDPDCAKIIAWIRTVNQISDAEFDAAVSRYIDIGEFITHVAVEQWLAEFDGVLGHTGMTNFYYYRRSADDLGYFLVWDKDGTFSTADWSVWTNTDVNVLARRVLAIPRYRARFLDTLHRAGEIAGGQGGWLEQEMDRALAQIRQAAIDDPNRACLIGSELGRCPIDRFYGAVDYLRQFTWTRRTFVDGQLTAAGFTPYHAIELNNEGAGNAASGAPVLTPGSLATLSVSLPSVQSATAQSLPLPNLLGGVRVRIGGVEAPILRVSATQVMLQVPWELACGPALVELVSGTAAATISVEVRPASAGFFAAVHPDGRVVSPQTPAAPGEMITLYGTGIGLITESEKSGEPAPLTELCPMKETIAAMLDGQPIPVLWAGLTPGFIGLQQVSVTIPASAARVDAILKIGSLGEWGKAYVLPIR